MDAEKYDKIAQAYSLLPEIPDSDQYRLSGAKLDKKAKLPGPQVGEQYGLYFNLQAMYNGVFGQTPKHGFKAMQSKMHLTDRQKAGKNEVAPIQMQGKRPMCFTVALSTLVQGRRHWHRMGRLRDTFEVHC